MPKIYQAGPLFSQAERTWHGTFKQRLEDAGHTVIWPGDLIEQASVDAWGKEAPRKIMEIDRDALLSCDVVVALLDGTQVDDGTAWEIGYACAKGIPVVGIRTDFRNGGDTGHSAVNAMIEGSVVGIAHTMDEVLWQLKALDLPQRQAD